MTEHRRLAWQCRRGMLELDLLLQGFLDAHYDVLPEAERQAFRTLLTYPDQTLLEYLLGQAIPDDESLLRVIQQIRSASAP